MITISILLFVLNFFLIAVSDQESRRIYLVFLSVITGPWGFTSWGILFLFQHENDDPEPTKLIQIGEKTYMVLKV